MKFLVAERISLNKYKTPEGYLVCVDSVLARTGKQTYRKDEIFDCDDSSEIQVDRRPEEVFSDATLASFENKPLTIEHPDEDVDTSNFKDLAVGFVRDIHRGKDNGQDVMLGTLVITDKQAIDDVESGHYKELSCGYDCDIEDSENPQQTNIRGNHVALCERGRAGIARIVDSVKDNTKYKIGSKVLVNGRYKGEVISFSMTTVNGKAVSSMIIKYGTTRIELPLDSDKVKLIDSVKDVKPDAGYKLIGNKYNWELEGKAKNEKDALAKFKRRYPESYNTWGEELEYLARIGKDFESEAGEWALHFRFDDDDGYFYICVIEFAKRYQDSTTDATMKQYEFKFIANEIDGEIITISFPCLSNEAAIATLRRRWTWTKMISVKIDGKEVKYQNGKIIDSEETQMKDKLVDIPSNLLSKLEDMFKQKNIHVARKGKTFTGRIHYQVEFGGRVKDLVRKLEEIEKTAKSLNIPMTFAADGNDDDTFATAGVDFDKQWINDSVKDSDELPEEEDSTFRYQGARGEEIFVTNYDGRNTFLVTGGKRNYNEKEMQRRDIERYLDEHGARFSKVIDSEENLHDKDDIQTAINDEVEAIEFYNKMLSGDLDKHTRAIIEEIRDDENDHLLKLTKIKNGTTSKVDKIEDEIINDVGPFLEITVDPKYQKEYRKAFYSACNKYGLQVLAESSTSNKYEITLVPQKSNSNPRRSMESLARDYELEKSQYQIRDSKDIKDATTTFEIRWIDTYKKSKGYVKEEYAHVDEIKADSLKEALKKLADKVALGGIGTANALIVSIHSDSTSYMYSGKLSELVNKVHDSSKVEKIIDAIRAIRRTK